MTDDFKKHVAAVVKDVQSASFITRADAEMLAERHGVSVRVVVAKAAAAGKYDRARKGSGLSHSESVGKSDPHIAQAHYVAGSRGSSDPGQYRVLQPAANLGAGCLTQWLWLIVIGAVLIAVAAVFQTFT